MNKKEIHSATVPDCPIRNVISHITDKWSLLVLYTTQMAEANLKLFATAGFTACKAHVAGDANVPGSIMEKPNELKAADEMVEWLLA